MTLTLLCGLLLQVLPQADQPQRPRARELGIRIGEFETGPQNAITDVTGVQVGQHSVRRGDDVRTGVTVILPHPGNTFREKLPCAVWVGNGFGKLSGSTQIRELGTLESPIALTNTLNVGKVQDALVAWILEQKGNEGLRSINAVVGETNDGRLNDIRGRHVTAEHLRSALRTAKAGPVAEGSVGAGTGTICFGWKGGIGTASRKTGRYTVGVLVQSNFGGRLRIDGKDISRELSPRQMPGSRQEPAPKDGSCMIIVATDAPLDSRRLERLAKRALVGMGRIGAAFSNGSGDYVIAFSTAESLRVRDDGKATTGGRVLKNGAMTPLFVAVADATEEAILNSILRATTTRGRGGRIVHAIPIPALKKVLGLDSAPSNCDVLIRGGAIIDGTGKARRHADLMISGDTITFIGEAKEVRAKLTIDANGKVVTPGFIDPHAHGDPRRTPGFQNFLAMGVTTICLGQDGVSPGGMPFDAWRKAVRKGRFAPNIAPFVGHGTMRQLSGIGMREDPNTKEFEAMAAMIDTAMQQGAFGLTMGLEYEPGRFAKPNELAALVAPVAKHHGLVMSHVRSEDDQAIEAAIRELLDACAKHRCAAQVSHMKIVYSRDPKRADAILDLLETARKQGSKVSADVYPYVASYTGIGIVFPAWARAPNDYAKVKAKRHAELATYLQERVQRRNGPSAILLGGGKWAGKTLAEVATELDKSFVDVLIDDLGPRGTSAAHSVMHKDVMERLLLADHVMISSDGSPTMRHPRGHGTFAKVIHDYVNGRKLLSLETAIYKMTGMPADSLGLGDRGRLQVGMKADVLVFDPSAIIDRATYAEPFHNAKGFDCVLINGVLVRSKGAFTDARPGRVLNH